MQAEWGDVSAGKGGLGRSHPPHTCRGAWPCPHHRVTLSPPAYESQVCFLEAPVDGPLFREPWD